MARMYFGFLNCLLFSVCLMACMDLMKAYPETQNGVKVTLSLDLDNLDLDQEDNLDLNLEAEDSKTTKALHLTTGNPPKDLSLKLYNLDLDQPSIDDLGLDLFEKADKSSSITENRPEAEAKVEPDSNSPIKLNNINITSKPEQDNINNDDIKVEYNETESIDDLNLSKNVPEPDLFLEEDDDNEELAEDNKVITTEKPNVDREDYSNYKTEAGKTEDLVKAKDKTGLSNLIAREDEDKHYQYKEDENETEREGDDENYTDNNDDNEETKSDYVNREGEEVDETLEENDHDIEPDEHYDTNKWFKPGNKEKVAADIDNTENVVDDFDEDEIRKQANFSKHPTAPSSMVLLYTWMIVAILIVVVGISTYQSRCKGLKFPFLSKKSSHGEDKKRLLDHEFV